MSKRVVQTNGPAIRNLRNLRGWTQKDLANRAGYTERLIRKAESGGTLGIQTAMDIAEALSQELHALSSDDFVLARDRLAAAQRFLEAFALHGQDMVAHVKYELTNDFILRIAVFSGSVSSFSNAFLGSSGLQLVLDGVAGECSIYKGLIDAKYTVGDGIVSARYSQKLWFAGCALDPFWVNLHFRFESQRIASIEVDYDTFAVSKIFSTNGISSVA
jgi:transcriptional regulator with XRE-family HTH domain